MLRDVIGILLRAAVAVRDDDPLVRRALRLEMRRREVDAVLRLDVPVLRSVVRLVEMARLRRHQQRIGPRGLLRILRRPALQAEVHAVIANKISRLDDKRRRHDDCRQEAGYEDLLHKSVKNHLSALPKCASIISSLSGKKVASAKIFPRSPSRLAGRIWNEVRILYQSRIGNPHGKGEYV